MQSQSLEVAVCPHESEYHLTGPKKVKGPFCWVSTQAGCATAVLGRNRRHVQSDFVLTSRRRGKQGVPKHGTCLVVVKDSPKGALNWGPTPDMRGGQLPAAND